MKKIILSSTKTITTVAFATLLSLSITGCDHSNKTTNGTQDTSNVTRAGGPAITDTASISAAEKQGKKDSTKKDTTAKGNVDPRGYTKKQ